MARRVQVQAVIQARGVVGQRLAQQIAQTTNALYLTNPSATQAEMYQAIEPHVLAMYADETAFAKRAVSPATMAELQATYTAVDSTRRQQLYGKVLALVHDKFMDDPYAPGTPLDAPMRDVLHRYAH